MSTEEIAENTPTPRQDTLKQVAEELASFDYKNFDPRKDKQILMDHLLYINAQLGKLLKGYP